MAAAQARAKEHGVPIVFDSDQVVAPYVGLRTRGKDGFEIHVGKEYAGGSKHTGAEAGTPHDLDYVIDHELGHVLDDTKFKAARSARLADGQFPDVTTIEGRFGIGKDDPRAAVIRQEADALRDSRFADKSEGSREHAAKADELSANAMAEYLSDPDGLKAKAPTIHAEIEKALGKSSEKPAQSTPAPAAIKAKAAHEMTRAEFEATGEELHHGTAHMFERFGEGGGKKSRFGRDIRGDRYYFTDDPAVARDLSEQAGSNFKQVQYDKWLEGVQDDLPHDADHEVELHKALNARIEKGWRLVYEDTEKPGGPLVEVKRAEDIPFEAYMDGDVRLYPKDRWPRTITTQVYGRTLDLTDPAKAPADLAEYLKARGSDLEAVTEKGRWQHEYSDALADYARENGYGKIKVNDSYESGRRSTIALTEMIGHNRDPWREAVTKAVGEGKDVPAHVWEEFVREQNAPTQKAAENIPDSIPESDEFPAGTRLKVGAQELTILGKHDTKPDTWRVEYPGGHQTDFSGATLRTGKAIASGDTTGTKTLDATTVTTGKRDAGKLAETHSQQDFRALPESQELPKSHHFHRLAAFLQDATKETVESLRSLSHRELKEMAQVLMAPHGGAKIDLIERIRTFADARRRLKDATVETLEQLQDRALMVDIRALGLSQHGNKHNHAVTLINWRDKSRSAARNLIADARHRAFVEKAIADGRVDELYSTWREDYPDLGEALDQAVRGPVTLPKEASDFISKFERGSDSRRFTQAYADWLFSGKIGKEPDPLDFGYTPRLKHHLEDFLDLPVVKAKVAEIEGGSGAPHSGVPDNVVKNDANIPVRPDVLIDGGAAHLGAEGTAYTPATNEAVPFRYGVVEKESLIPSHTDDFTENKAYDQSLQPRDRSRAASQEQVDRLARELNPERLGEAPSTADGAPIVGKDGLVESGNGRTMALRRAYAAGGDTAKRYRERIEQDAARFGLDPDAIKGMKEPVLVRIRTSDLPMEERARLAEAMGADPTARMSATETARVDGRRLLSSEALTLFIPNDNGRIDTVANNDFKRAFLSLIPDAQRADLIGPDGGLSADGERRIKAAILAAAFDDGYVLTRILESADRANVGIALLSAAPKLALMKRAIQAGHRYSLDITEDIAAAANRVNHLGGSGKDLAEAITQDLAQMGMFGDLSEPAKWLLQYFGQHNRSAKRMGDFLGAYADIVEALGDPAQGGLFGKETPSVASALEAARQLMEEKHGKTEASGTLDFEAEAEPGPRGDDAGRGAGAGPVGAAAAASGDATHPAASAESEGGAGSTPEAPTSVAGDGDRSAIADGGTQPAVGEFPAKYREFIDKGIDEGTINYATIDRALSDLRRQDAGNLMAGGRGGKVMTGAEARAMRQYLRDRVLETVPTIARKHVKLALALEAKIADALRQDGVRLDWRDLAKTADDAFEGSQAAGTYGPRDMYDALEVAVNAHIRKTLPDLFAKEPAEAIMALERILEVLPTQTLRTDAQTKLQQFSTPPTEAYAAVKALGNLHGLVVLEPSAGTGSLANMAKLAGAAEVYVNEHTVPEANLRAALLEAQGFKVSRRDAERIDAMVPAGTMFDVVVMNPPFSSSVHVEHNRTELGASHVGSAARLLAPGGRIVAIVGRGMTDGAAKLARWFGDMKGQYGYRANLLVDGKGYARYGTEFDNRVLVFDQDTARKGDAAAQPDLFTTEPENMRDVAEKLARLGEERKDARQSAAHPDGSGPATAGSGGTATPGGVRTPDVPPTGGDTVAPGQLPGGSPGRGSNAGGAAGAAGNGAGPGRGPGTHPDGGPAGSGDAAGGAGGRGGRPGAAGAADGAGGGRVPDPDAGADTPGILSDPRILADVEKAAKKTADEDLATFTTYQPEIKVGNGHPAVLVETASMAGVNSPLAHMDADKIASYLHFKPEVLGENRLSDAQLEPVILAQMRHEKALPNGATQGYMVGDGTGTGKGRISAGVIVNNWEQGNRRVLWLTANHKELAGAAERDLGNVGGWDQAPDAEGQGGVPRIKTRAINDWKNGDKIEGHDEGVIISSYDSLANRERLAAITAWLRDSPKGSHPVIIMDEAHKAQNAAVLDGRAKPSARGAAVVHIQDALPDARVTYLTATTADDVQNLGFATRLGLWGDGTPFPDFPAFAGFVRANGIAGMEMIAREAKMLGAYNARTIAFTHPDGRPIEHRETVVGLTPEMKTQYDKATDQWALLLQMADEYVKKERLTKKELQSFTTQFWGAHQRFFRSLLTSFKAPTIIRMAEEAIRNGQSPVISLDSTNESAMMEKIAAGLEAGMTVDDMDFAPKEALQILVNRMWPTQLHQPRTDPDTGRTEMTPVWQMPDGSYEVLPYKPHDQAVPVEDPEKVRIKQEVIAKVGTLDVPGNLLDQIVLHFGPQHVAELTGRSNQLVYGKDGKLELKRRAKPRGSSSKSVRHYEANEFNQGRRKLAVFTRAAAQGIDLHAGNKFRNKNPRLHIVAETGWLTKDEMQKLGRTHRSDQAHAPTYELVTTDAGGERRFVSALAANLAQLGAIQRGDRGSAGAGALEQYNYNSDYGYNAALAILNGLEKADAAKMGLTVEKIERVDGEKALATLFNRLLMLPFERQNQYVEAFQRLYDQQIASAKAAGVYTEAIEDVKAENLRALKTTEIYADPHSGAKTHYYELEGDVPNRKVSWSKLQADAVGEGGEIYRNTKGGLVYAHFFERTHPVSGAKEYLARLRRPNGVVEVKDAEWVRKTYTRAEASGDLPPGSPPNVPVTGAGDRSKDALKAEWNEQVAALPDYRQERYHVIAGVTFPIFDRIHGERKKIVRVPLPGGERVVGIEISAEGLNQTLRDLGVLATDAADPESVFRGAMAMKPKEAIKLAGSLELRSATFQGNDAIEIRHSDYGDIRSETLAQKLKGYGAIEAGKWGKSYYIPTDEAAGAAVITKLLADHKVIDLPASLKKKDKPVNPGLSAFGAGYLTAIGPKVYQKAIDFFSRDYKVAIAYDEALSKYVEAGDTDRSLALDDIRQQFGWKAGSEQEQRFKALGDKTLDFEERWGKELVKQGLITKEAFEANRGQHLRRLYAFFENPDAWMRELERQMKAQGLDPELAAARLASERTWYERLTNRDPDDLTVAAGGPTEGGRVNKKKFKARDSDDATRDFLGEIKLASTRVERGGTIAAREVAKTRMNRVIARGLGVTKPAAIKITELRKDAIKNNTVPTAELAKMTPGQRLYFHRPDLYSLVRQQDGLKGAINHYIPKQIYKELMKEFETPSRLRQFLGSALTWWKIGKTVGGMPGSWAGNVMGNLVLSQRENMLPMVKPQRYQQAIRSAKAKDVYWRWAQQVAEYPYENFRLELPHRGETATSIPYPQTPKERVKAGTQAAVDRSIDAYGSIDTIFKHALFIDAMQRARKLGFSDLESAREAAGAVDRTYPNFRTGTPIRALRPSVQYLRQGWLPFVSWDASAIPLLARAFRDHPGRMAAFPLAYGAYQRVVESSRRASQSEEERGREDKSRPPYMRGRYQRLPGPDPRYVNIEPANPVGGSVFADSPADIAFDRLNPLLSLSYALYMNRAQMTGLPIWHDQDLPADKAKKGGTYAAKAVAPTILGYGGDRLKEIATGQATRPIVETDAYTRRATARGKLTPMERVEKAGAELSRMPIKTLDVPREKRNRWLSAKEKLSGTKTVLRQKVREIEAHEGKRPDPAAKKKLMAPYREIMEREIKELPR